MSYKTWKRLFWICLVILCLLMLFTVGLWIVCQILMVSQSLIFTGGIDETMPNYTFWQYLSTLPNSPLGDAYVLPSAGLLCSIIGLIVKRKENK